MGPNNWENTGEITVELTRDPSGRARTGPIGRFFAAIAGADPTGFATTADRNRYVNVSILMLLTAAQALYSATTVAAMGLDRPFVTMLPFGAFFAGFVFFIDRSIVSDV